MINRAISRMKLDSAPGRDRILVRTVQDTKAGPCIKAIIDTMLVTSDISKGLQDGQGILKHKKGHNKNIDNFRLITIYSCIRRVIKKVLNDVLRAQLDLNRNQRGFVVGLPGCHVNAPLVNGCLTKAKERKDNCTVAFLDVTKAFDSVGHEHIERALRSQGVSCK